MDVGCRATSTALSQALGSHLGRVANRLPTVDGAKVQAEATKDQQLSLSSGILWSPAQHTQEGPRHRTGPECREEKWFQNTPVQLRKHVEPTHFSATGRGRAHCAEISIRTSASIGTTHSSFGNVSETSTTSGALSTKALTRNPPKP